MGFWQCGLITSRVACACETRSECVSQGTIPVQEPSSAEPDLSRPFWPLNRVSLTDNQLWRCSRPRPVCLEHCLIGPVYPAPCPFGASSAASAAGKRGIFTKGVYFSSVDQALLHLLGWYHLCNASIRPRSATSVLILFYISDAQPAP